MFIRSERLFLRPAWPEDRAEVELALGVEAARLAALPTSPRHPRFVITLPDHRGAQALGLIALWHADGETQAGIWIAPQWRGRGFATEGLRAVLPLLRVLGHRRVLATPAADCPASRAVLARIGFAPTGTLHLHAGVLRETHALALCAAATDPADPAGMMRAA
jgi:RimJ/RimL family protein N-acetyltransferase